VKVGTFHGLVEEGERSLLGAEVGAVKVGTSCQFVEGDRFRRVRR